MKSNYRRIGDFIELVDIRNSDLKITKLLGLSISKQFIPSVANIIGTNMTNYKIIKKNQFACSIMQVRRDRKMPVALLRGFDEAIISQAYPVFEIIKTEELLPDYLMMWFTRSEFDRHAEFLAVGGVRGSLEWEDFLGMTLPVPSLEKQKELVDDYNIVQDRIRINQELNTALEETAQTLYKHWFVDFEFPVHNVSSSAVENDLSTENSIKTLGYKASGGTMVFNEELDCEIPVGWEVVELETLLEIKYGKDYKHLSEGNIPMFGSGGIMKFVNKSIYSEPSVLIPRKGSLSNVIYLNKPFWSVDTMFYSIFRVENIGHYIFQFLNRLDFYSLNVGSAVPSMTTKLLNSLEIIKPKDSVLKIFNLYQEELFNAVKNNRQECDVLMEACSILLSKMATVID